MSNDKDTNTMPHKPPRNTTPRLRFPEFWDAGAWEEKTLGELFDLEKKPEKAMVFDNENVITVKLHTLGVVKNERNSTLTGGANYFKRRAGEFIFSKIDLLNGAFGLVPDELDGFLSSSDVPAFTFKTENSSLFFLNWLKANYLNLIIERTGTSSTLKRVSPEKFLNLSIYFPGRLEQQRIAECLTALDDLIAAQAQQLDALKAHKTGLMQQLFPAEGETVPRLRFPEFEGKGEWEEKLLGDLLLSRPDYGINAPAVPYSEDLPAYLRITDISEEGVYLSGKKVSVDIDVRDENYLEEGDITLARTGASVGKSYKYKIEDGALVFAGYLIRIKPDANKIVSAFLFNFLFTKQYWKWVGATSMRSGQPGINGNEYANLSVPVPPINEEGELLEQRRIADCLTALDDLIAAQRQKLDALKAHKTGLMQQLFPVVER